MYKEAYERLSLDVTRFDVEDVITTSGQPPYMPDGNEMVGPTNVGPMPGGF